MNNLTLKFATGILLLISFSSCQQKENTADAYGNFEATEVMVASQVAGPIVFLDITEGEVIDSGKLIALIDTVPLDLKRKQLIAQREGTASKNKNIVAQIDVLNQQLQNLSVDQKRFQNLLAEGSVTQKQVDDINGQIDVLKKQIASVESQNAGVAAELKSGDAQMQQVNDQISRSHIYNPIKGTVLTKYAEQSEIAAPGKNLYKIADLNKIELRAYISGEQLSSIKIGEHVKVKFDLENGTSGEATGIVSWIASSAEFTPKIVQTKEERTNLVYAIKVSVENKDGKIKIGMPGEMVLGN